MRHFTLFVVMALAAGIAVAQPVDIDTTTEEGRLLQQIGSEENTQQKVALLEEFAEKYPNHDAIVWVLGQLPPAYVELQQPQKSLSWCERLMAKDPANAAAAHSCLKTAEGLKDPALIEKWALATHAAAKKVVDAPTPEFEYEEDEQEYKQTVDFAKQVGQYSEWSLYNAALQTADPAMKIELIDALRKANPESEHLPQLITQAFLAYRQAGMVDKAVELAEQEIAKNTANEDMMLVAADYYLNQKKDAAKALEYSQKLVAYLEPKGPPEGVDPAAWEQKKKTTLGVAYWMIGSTYSNQGKYVAADKILRKALPNVKENKQLLAGTLFHLGFANYQLGNKSGSEQRILAAFKYTKQCAAMASPFQGQARANLKAIQSQYRIQ